MCRRRESNSHGIAITGFCLPRTYSRSEYSSGSRARPAPIFILRAAGENRTLMGLLPHDFESCASAGSATAAKV